MDLERGLQLRARLSPHHGEPCLQLHQIVLGINFRRDRRRVVALQRLATACDPAVFILQLRVSGILSLELRVVVHLQPWCVKVSVELSRGESC